MKNWNNIDELCLECNSVTKRATGFNKQNIKRLFLTVPSLQDMMILLMLCACLLLAWAYQSDVKEYKEIIENPTNLCMFAYQEGKLNESLSDINESSYERIDYSSWEIDKNEQG